MKRNQIRTLSILAAIALLLGIALFALRYEKPPAVLPKLADCQPEEILNLSYTNLQGTFSFQKSGDGWVLSSDDAFPVNAETIGKMLEVLCSLQPQSVVENPDPEELGLLSPQCTIYYTHPSGSGMLTVGSMNAVTDQLYVLSGDTVYLTDTSLLQAFGGSLLDTAQQIAIPKPDNHQRVEVENFLGTLTLSCLASDTGHPDGTWCTLQEDGTWVEADQTAAYNFYFLTWDMHWKSTAGYITDSAQLADYGLDNPQVRYTLTYGGETFEVLFGTNLPDNTTYVLCPGSNLVYTMDTLLAQWLAQAKRTDVIPSTLS